VSAAPLRLLERVELARELLKLSGSGPRIRARTRARRCYELAARGLLQDPSWRLVHGTNLGMAGHAWLTKDGIVYDAVRDQYMAADVYAQKRGAVAERHYGPNEAAEQVCLAGHWGPWHETAGAVQGVIRRRR
jgi:hypothetical protein